MRYYYRICVAVVFLIAFTAVLTGCQADAIGRKAGLHYGDASYTKGLVAADHVIGSEAGAEMLRLGGNAVDAAVAASFCQEVVRPYSCGLGGGGFMVIRMARQSAVGRDGDDEKATATSVALVYRETSPSAVGPSFYVDLGMEDASQYGPYASGVPGSVAGLLRALATYGTFDRETVLGPAIRAAESGFRADAHYVNAAESVLRLLEEKVEIRERIGDDGYTYLMETFLSNGSPKVGDVIRQPALGRTLRLIAKYGESVFYSGEIAEAIAERSPTITRADLERYQCDEVRPLEGRAFGYTFLTTPPPSSGGVALQEIFGIVKRHWDDVSHDSPMDPEYDHLLVEAMKHAFADRAEWLADDRFADVPTAWLTSEDYIDELSSRFDSTRTLDSNAYGSRRGGGPGDSVETIEDHGTSHLSVVDQWGNAVACTETINLEFGSLFVIPEYGIVMNNEMDDFLTTPGEANAFGLTQSDRNLAAAGKRPLSSMSPTIVLDGGGEVAAVAGASGGPRIITGTMQVLMNGLVFDMNARDAVGAPRLHHQWMPNAVYLEDGWTDEASIKVLEAKGHEIWRRRDIGNVQLILRSRNGAGYEAASDPRKGGEPAAVK